MEREANMLSRRRFTQILGAGTALAALRPPLSLNARGLRPPVTRAAQIAVGDIAGIAAVVSKSRRGAKRRRHDRGRYPTGSHPDSAASQPPAALYPQWPA